MTNSNLSTIQSLWIGPALSTMEQLSINSFLHHGHNFDLYVYDQVQNVPAGANLKDAAKIISPDKIFKYPNHDSYAGFANLFRYKLLLENGGYWVDMDMVCLKPFLFSADYVLATERLRIWRGWSQVTCSLIKVPAHSEIMDYCYQAALSRAPSSLKWGDTGPKLINKAVKIFQLQQYLAHPYIFCPINFWQSQRLITDSAIINQLEDRKINSYQSHAIHLWNEMWRRNHIDKNAQFPPNSIYERIKKRYLNRD